LTQEEQELRKKSEWLKNWDSEQRELRSKRLLEIESPQLAGQGYLMTLPSEVPGKDKMAHVQLEGSISRILNEARMSYVYGFFQAAVFQIGAIAELLIEETLRVKEKWGKYELKYPPTGRWLGTLIKFCEDNDIVPKETLVDLKRINELRIDAVHMNTEKEEYGTPPDEHPLIATENISSCEPDRVVSKAVLPGQPIIIDMSNPAKPTLKTELTYKPQAAEGFAVLSRVFFDMRKSQKPRT
jgi:hypothetical protein